MKIDVTQTVDVPKSPFCGNCHRKTHIEGEYSDICELFGKYVFIHEWKFLKCRECYQALYDAIAQEE